LSYTFDVGSDKVLRGETVMNDESTPKGPLTRLDPDDHHAQSAPESFAEVIKPLVPVMTSYLDHQAHASEQQTQLQKQQLDLSRMQAQGSLEFAKERLKSDDKRQSRQFWLIVMLLVPIVIVALGTSIGLVFLKDNVSAGIFLLTHLVAFAVGLVGGAGWQRAKQDAPRQQP